MKNEFTFTPLILKIETQNLVPGEIQICPIGEFTDSEGKRFLVTEDNIRAIIANNSTRKTQPVIDYEHQTLYGNEAPAAGWIIQLVNKGKDGLWAIIEWTKRAQQYFENKEYRYLSPVLLASKKNKDGLYLPEILHSAALTNTPQIDGMVPIVNRNCGKCNNNPQTPGKEDGMLKKILELLGLKPEATENEAAEALTVLKNKAAASAAEANGYIVELKKVREALGLAETANHSEITGTILALKQPVSVVSVQEFSDLKKKLAIKERDEQVVLAMAAGKITAAQKDWAAEYALRDLEGFKVFVAKAPVIVPMGELPPGTKQEGDALNDTTLLVAKMMGNKPEDIKKQLASK